MDDQHPNKPQNGSSSLSDGEHQDILWFEDGDVVLQVQATQFRVHKGILAVHSSVFKDMFSFPQPAESVLRLVIAESVDGCPLVHLQDESDDWKYLLKALYYPDFRWQAKSHPFPVFRAILRLGRKYDFATFYAQATSCLRAYFPSTLGEWDHRETSAIINYEGLEIELANLIRELEMFDLLPYALFNCMELYDTKGLFLGVQPTDADPVIRLCPEDIIRTAMAREYIIQMQTGASFNWFGGGQNLIPSQGCTEQTSCREQRITTWEIVWDSLVATPPDGIVSWNKFRAYGAELCTKCLSKAKEIHNEGRLTLWKDLPKAMGLAVAKGSGSE